MKSLIPVILILAILFGLILVSGGVLVWLSLSVTGELNRPQEILISTADWLIKACAGAILGFTGGARLANGRGGGISG